MKLSSFSITSIILLSLSNAQAQSIASNTSIVQMQNATNCHVRSNGMHYLGVGVSPIRTFSDWHKQYGTIAAIGSWGDVPIVNGDTVILTLVDAKNEYGRNYHAGDQFIISDDTTNCYSQTSGLRGCFKLASVNPCA